MKFNASRASNFGNNASNAYDDDADVVIESEEIQPSAIVNQSTVSNMLPNADEEKRTQWSSNMSFASTLQQPNVGFSVTNSGFNHNNRTGSPQVKQPRLAPHAIEKHPNVPEIIREIEKNNRILICMRGAPGSGKSYLAHSIIDKTMHGDYANHIFSTDDFFLNPRTKRYCFDRSRLSEAHDTNQNRVAQRAMNGWSPIIVDNTNMQLWEMFPYFREATRNGYIIKILEPKTPWRISVGKLAQRNKHNVDQETIARMLEKYEPGSVQDVLRAMQIHNYKMEPKLRNFPEIVEQPKQADQPTPMYNWSNVHGQSNENSRFTPREQRPRKQGSDRKQTEAFDADTFETIFKKLGNVQEDWPAYEEEQGSFWNSEAIAKPKPDQNIPKPQRKPSGNASASDMYNLLVDSKKKTKKDKRKDSDHAELTKHKKNCPNENKSFQAIRQIYPTIPVSLLWDLFEKCNGDGDWTMDILLNESETKELQTLNTQSEIDQDDFGCYCDNPLGGPSVSNPDLTQAAIAIPNEWLKDSRANVLPPRGSRRPKNSISESEVRKQIEEQFVISDDRYSEHTRKIRNLRRGAAATTVSHEASNNDRNAEAVDTEEINEDDEMIQMDLGIELVCQLDQTFGSSTFQHNGLKDIKTTVFMPKTLGQQLYAIWVESLYNQIEEQRQQSYKADEEFARELQVKQPQSSIFEVPPKPNIQNIADMEYTWKAYRTEPNEWKQTTPEDLATKLTKAKLFEIFPNVDREQLIDVFSTYGNKFAKTVDFFKESLKSEIDDKMQSNGQELVTQARNEAQAVSYFLSFRRRFSKKLINITNLFFRSVHPYRIHQNRLRTKFKKVNRWIRWISKKRNVWP